MSVDTLYTGTDAKTAVKRVRIAGTLLPTVLSVDWQFAIGKVPSATVRVPNPPPVNAQFFADVTIDVGFNGLYERVFTGKVTDVNRSENDCQVMCLGMSQFLDRTSDDVAEITILNKTNIETLEYLFGLAGIDYYTISMDSWTMGTAQALKLAFSSYAEAVTKVAEIDGGRWMETPTGLIVVQPMDPIPSVSVKRKYFSMELTALVEAYPAGIIAADGRPRVRNSALTSRVEEVKNRIYVRGATVTETIGDLEVSDDIDWKLEGPSDYVKNPDGSQAYHDLLFSNDLIDTYEKAEEVAIRLHTVWNRVPVQLSATVEGDPLLSLASTLQVEDPRYSGASGRYFLEGYQSALSSSDFQSQIQAVGEGAGPNLPPIAQFTYCQVMYVVIDDRMYAIITFDARGSMDPDGTIASYAWSDNKGWVAGTAPVVSVRVDADLLYAAGWQVTLTVTDNDGESDAVTLTVSAKMDECADACVTIPPMFLAFDVAESATPLGGDYWNNVTDAGVQCVAAPVSTDPSKVGMALYGTSDGQILRTLNFCVTALTTVFAPGGSIVDIRWEAGTSTVYALSRNGLIYRSTSDGASGTWSLWANLRTALPRPNSTWNRLYPIAGEYRMFVCGGSRDSPGRPIIATAEYGGGGPSWSEVPIGGELATDIPAAPSDLEVKDIAISQYWNLAIILTSATFTTAVYYTDEALGDGSAWKRCTGLPAKSYGRWIEPSAEVAKFMFAYADNALYKGDVTAGVMACTAAAGALTAGDVSNMAFWVGDPNYGVPGQGDVYIISGEGAVNGTLYITWNRGANVGKVYPATGFTVPPTNANAKFAAIGSTLPCPDLYLLRDDVYPLNDVARLDGVSWRLLGPSAKNHTGLLKRLGGNFYRIHDSYGPLVTTPGTGTLQRAAGNDIDDDIWVDKVSRDYSMKHGVMCVTAGPDGTVWCGEVSLSSPPSASCGPYIWKSVDGGVTFTRVWTGFEKCTAPSHHSIYDIAVDRLDVNRMLAVCHYSSGLYQMRFLKSMNGGATWSDLVGFSSTLSYQYGQHLTYGDKHRVIWVNGSSNGGVIRVSDDDGVTWRTRFDAGAWWTARCGGAFVGACYITRDPATLHRFVVGYCYVSGGSGCPYFVIFKSENNGEDWEQVAEYSDVYPSCPSWGVTRGSNGGAFDDSGRFIITATTGHGIAMNPGIFETPVPPWVDWAFNITVAWDTPNRGIASKRVESV